MHQPLPAHPASAAEHWIAHRGPMRLIDRVLQADEAGAVAEVDVAPDGLFARDGRVPPWVGIEYMAQTVAAWATGRGRRAGRDGPRLGLLLGTRRYEAFCDGFDAGTTLRIEVRNEWNDADGMGLFDCRVLLADRLLASARITVFEPADGHRFLPSGDTA